MIDVDKTLVPKMQQAITFIIYNALMVNNLMAQPQ